MYNNNKGCLITTEYYSCKVFCWDALSSWMIHKAIFLTHTLKHLDLAPFLFNLRSIDTHFSLVSTMRQMTNSKVWRINKSLQLLLSEKNQRAKKKKSPQKNPGIFQSEDAQNGNQDVIHDRVKVLEWPSLRKHQTDWGHKFCALWKIYKFVETMIQGGNDFPESFSYFIQQ